MSGRKMRKSLLAQLMMFALTVTGLYYVGFHVLGGSSTTGSMHLTIVAPTSGGLYPKSEVTYRGVRVGTVAQVIPRATEVEIHLNVDPGADIPADTAARLTYLSPIGEQMVEFRPRRTGPPYLTDGDVITGKDVTIAAPFSDTIVRANDLLSSIRPRDLHTIVDESYAAFNGHGTDLARTIDDSGRMLDAMATLGPRIRRLLLDSRRPLATLNGQAGNLRRFSGAAAQVTRQLRASRRDVVGLIDNGVTTTDALHGFLHANGPALTRAVAALVPTWQVLSISLPALRALLPAFPAAMGALAAVLRQGSVNAIAIAQGPVLCSYDQKRRSPYDIRHLPLYDNSACPRPRGSLERGWQNAGRG
ncbi:MAG TPA: MlaD family protein [Nocardioides sp.]|nr:MlaD family protein [Nocardioides sp.]